MVYTVYCSNHRNYKARRPPISGCRACALLYAATHEQGAVLLQKDDSKFVVRLFEED